MTQNTLRRTLFALIGVLIFAGVPVACAQQTPADNQKPVLCKLTSLPPDVAISLKNELVSWKIVEPGDLDTMAREKWMAGKSPTCPGIAVGKFENSKMRSYAVLLIHANHEDTGYKFLAFSHQPGELSYTKTVIEESQGSPPGSFFIRTAALRSVLDAKMRKQLKTEAPEGILFVDSAEQHKESDIYFRANGGYQHQAVKQ